MSSWKVKGIGAQCFVGATVADVLREMADFADEWTEAGESMDRFVSDVAVRYDGDDDCFTGIVYTDDTSHITTLLKQAFAEANADSTGVSQNGVSRAGLPADELDFESLYDTGQVINIESFNVFVGGA